MFSENSVSETRPKSAARIFKSKKSLTKDKKYPHITMNKPRNSDDPYKTFIKEVEGEEIYKENLSLKEKINDLKETIHFLKSNNQKLNMIILKKNKEIDRLISDNFRLESKVRKAKKKEGKRNDDGVKSSSRKPQETDKKNPLKKEEKEEKKESIEDNFEAKNVEKKVKEQTKEIEGIKKTFNTQLLLIKEKDREIKSLKKNVRITKENEERIENEILLEEMSKLKDLFKSQNSTLKSNFFNKEEVLILKDQIQNQHKIIVKLLKENNELKSTKIDIKEQNILLKRKLESSNNMKKYIGDKCDQIENSFRKKLRNEAVSVFEKKEKEELINKIKKLSESLEYYRMQVMKGKNFGAEAKSSTQMTYNGGKKMPLVQGETSLSALNSIFNVKRKQIGVERPNPEEKYGEKILLMQSIISELKEENSDLTAKVAFYESEKGKKKGDKSSSNIKINKNNDRINDDSKSNIEVLDGKNKEKNEDMEMMEDKLIISDKTSEKTSTQKRENENKLQDLEEKITLKRAKIDKFKISFEDIFLFNCECKNITSSNAKQLFGLVFNQFRDRDLDNDETYKDSVLDSLTTTISLSLSISNDREKAELKQYLLDLFESDDNSDFEGNFYSIFDSVTDHLNEATQIIEKEYEKTVKLMLRKKKDVVDNICSSFSCNINLCTLYELLYKSEVYLKKEEFFYLCYLLKTDDNKSMYNIGTKYFGKLIN